MAILTFGTYFIFLLRKEWLLIFPQTMLFKMSLSTGIVLLYITACYELDPGTKGSGRSNFI